VTIDEQLRQIRRDNTMDDRARARGAELRAEGRTVREISQASAPRDWQTSATRRCGGRSLRTATATRSLSTDLRANRGGRWTAPTSGTQRADMRSTDRSALGREAQAAADRDRGATIIEVQCRERYALTDDELAALGPPRIGAPWPGSREPTKVFRLEVVLELLKRLHIEREARERAAAEARITQLGAPAAVPEDEATVAARGAA
jgi:hypothetical protein